MAMRTLLLMATPTVLPSVQLQMQHQNLEVAQAHLRPRDHLPHHHRVLLLRLLRLGLGPAHMQVWAPIQMAGAEAELLMGLLGATAQAERYWGQVSSGSIFYSLAHGAPKTKAKSMAGSVHVASRGTAVALAHAAWPSTISNFDFQISIFELPPPQVA